MTLQVRLDQLDPGCCGVVRDVEAGSDEVDLLKSMGVCIGREVMLVQAGDPLVLKVMGTRLGVSARLAARVRVEPESEREPAQEFVGADE